MLPLALPEASNAAINKRINFQANLTDPAGNAVADGTYNIEFKIENDPSASGGGQGTCSGSCLWVETRTGVNRVSVLRGRFAVQLGEITALSSAVFSTNPIYLSIRVGGTGSTPTWDVEMTPRNRVGDIACTGCVTSTDIQDGTVSDVDLAAGVGVPVGTILPFWGTILPSNFAWADGSSLSCVTYPALCAAQGATISVTLPDLRGRTPVGVDGAAARLASSDTFGASGGAETQTLTTAQIPSHTHGAGTFITPYTIRGEIQYLTNMYNDYLTMSGWGAISGWNNTPKDAITGTSGATGGGSPHSSMQPYQIVNYMVRVA